MGKDEDSNKSAPVASTAHPLGASGEIIERAYPNAERRIKHAAIESSINAIAMAGLDGKLFYVNQAFVDLWCLQGPDDALGRSPLEFWEKPEEAQRVMDALRSQGRWQGELRARRHDGSLADLLLSAHMVKDSTGKPLCMMASFVDISARKYAEEKLRQSEALLNTIVQQIPAMVFLKRASDLRFELLNHTGEALLGLKQDALLGKCDHDFFPSEQADFFTARDREVLANGQLLNIPEEPILTRNGKTHILHTRKIGIYNAVGEPTHLLGISLDITEQKRAEAALRESEARLQEAQRIAQMGSWELNLLTGELNWSDEIFHLFEIDQAQFGATYAAFLNAIHPDDRDRVNQAYTHSLASRMPYEIIHRLLMADGRIKWVHERCVSEFDSKGKPLRSVGTVQDITQEKQAELALENLNATLEQRVQQRTAELSRAREEADRANHAKSEFLSRMSHELRTPLNAIIGFSQLLEADPTHLLAPDQADNAREILHAGRHLLDLVNEVLDLARIESGQLTLAPQAVAIVQLIQECVALIQPLAAQRQIQITIDTDDDCAIQSDRLRLRQILLNLLSNAIKYNHEAGSVQISCKEINADRARIAVRDSGRGIAVDALPRLFKPFERMESAYEAIEGSGIGLALCKQLAEAMGGTIGVESTVGSGSTFWVELPLAMAEATVPVTQTPTQPRQTVHAVVRTLLYVEDNPANQRLVQKIIATRADMKLLLAHSAELGLDLAKIHLPDLILLDINLPGMNGFEALHQLQQDPATRDIPVIAITANAMARDVQRGREAGFVEYLTKPLDVPRFMALLDKVLLELSQHKAE